MIPALIPRSVHSDVKPFDRQPVKLRLEGDITVNGYYRDGRYFMQANDLECHPSHWYEPVSLEYLRKAIPDGNGDDTITEFK